MKSLLTFRGGLVFGSDWELPGEVKVLLLPGQPAVAVNHEHLARVQVLQLDLLQVPRPPGVQILPTDPYLVQVPDLTHIYLCKPQLSV